MTIEEASKIVERGARSRPDFPSGKDYVDEVRHGKPSPAQSQPENPYPHLKRNNYITGELECPIDCPACAFEAGKASRIPTKELEQILRDFFWKRIQMSEAAAAIVALIEERSK